MSDVTRSGVFAALRSALKARGITYAELARRLGMSEPSVKRLFQQQDCKLSRLAAICTAIDLPLETLIEASNRPAGPSVPLSHDAERHLAAYPSLFYFLLFLMDRFTPQQIARETGLSQASIELYMRNLDRLGIVERDVSERYRLLITTPVAWRWTGPLAPILKRINQDFVGWAAENAGEPGVQFITLSRRMRADSADMLQREADEFAERIRQTAHRDQLMSADSELMTAKLTLALAPFAFHRMRRIDEHPQAGSRAS